MIAIYSYDHNFNAFAKSVLSAIEIIPFLFNDHTKLAVVQALEIRNFLILSEESSKSDIKLLCDKITKENPNSNIAIAVKSKMEAPARFSEIEGIDKQIIIPCNENMFKQMLFRYFSFSTSFGVLKFEQRNRGVTLLGYPISLSKTDYIIVKLLVAAEGKAIDSEAIAEILKVSKNCLSAHICTINKKAFDLTNRKLIIHTNRGYMLNPFM